MRSLWLAAPVTAWLAGSTAGCTGDAPPACITVDATCAPLYAPTFDNVYTMTLKNTCGSTLSSCHSAAGEGGLGLQDEGHAYGALLAGRVVPGDPACSKLIVWIDALGTSYQMPPGDPMSEPERCALRQWVAAGAPGPGAALGGTRGAAPGAALGASPGAAR